MSKKDNFPSKVIIDDDQIEEINSIEEKLPEEIYEELASDPTKNELLWTLYTRYMFENVVEIIVWITNPNEKCCSRFRSYLLSHHQLKRTDKSEACYQTIKDVTSFRGDVSMNSEKIRNQLLKNLRPRQ